MPEHDLTRTDRMALYIRARADAKAARDEAVRVVEGENAALSEVPCDRRPSARAKGLGASCGAGTAPADLTVTGLARALPYSWAEQESNIGSRNTRVFRARGLHGSVRAGRKHSGSPRSEDLPSVALNTQRALCEPVIGPSNPPIIDISKIPCKFPAPAKKFPARHSKIPWSVA